MKKNKQFLILLLLFWLPLVRLDAQSNENQILALVGGRLIDGFGGPPLENSVVLIRGNKITAVGQVGIIEIPSGTRILDTNGKTILPGLWESHGHLFHVGEADPNLLQARFPEAIPEMMERVAGVTLRAGVTSLREFCTICADQADGWDSEVFEQQKRLKDRISDGQVAGPRLFLSGPVISPVAPGRGSEKRYQVATVEEAREATRRLAEMGADNIFAGSSTWPVDLLRAILETAHQRGLGVDIETRHIDALDSALESGVDRIHVLFTAEALAEASDEELRRLIRGDRPSSSGPSANILRGPWILSTLQMRDAYVRAKRFPESLDHPDLKELVPPEVYEHLKEGWANPQAIPWGIGAEARVEVVKRKLKRFVAMGGREQLVAATDVGAPLNFPPAVARQMEHLLEAGLTPMEVIQSATLRPAQMQGVQDELGTVSVGKVADLIVVDGDPLQNLEVLQYRVIQVIKDGRLVR